MGPYDELMAGAALDLVTRHDARPASSAMHPEGGTTLTYDEPAESADQR
jgi:hypothetical protein